LKCRARWPYSGAMRSSRPRCGVSWWPHTDLRISVF
jgi:hypothetical protein